MNDRNFPDGVLGLRLLATAAVLGGKETEIPAQPHPDAELLELCAQVLDLHAQHDAIWREARELPRPWMDDQTYRQEMAKRKDCAKIWKPALGRIGRIPSKTGAGIYAKAMVIRDGSGTAPALVLSLVEDLVACPGLRAAIWPTTMEGK